MKSNKTLAPESGIARGGKRKPATDVRSAVTGKFVPKSKAKTDPATTVTTRRKGRGEMSDPMHKPSRDIIERIEGGIRVCDGIHQLSQDCEWEYFVPKGEVERLEAENARLREAMGGAYEVGQVRAARTRELEAEVERLIAENAELRAHETELRADKRLLISLSNATADELRADVARLREALEQYADLENWVDPLYLDDARWRWIDDSDGPELARRALEGDDVRNNAS